MDQIVRIEQELDGFKDTLSLYRQQLGSFLSGMRTGLAGLRICRR